MDGNIIRTKHKKRGKIIIDSSKIKIDSSKIEDWKEINKAHTK